MYNFSQEQLRRYARHFSLRECGFKGQEKILESKVLIVGAGGLGSPVAYYLAAAGVGEIGIIDADNVDLSNLQRQILHSTADLGTPKVESAQKKLQAMNPDVTITTFLSMLDSHNALEIISQFDVVVDGCDNFASKFLINDACVLLNKPYSHGGILRFSGQSMSVKPKESACYACIFDSPPPQGSVPSCAEAGVFGSVAGILGSIQATEVLKIITGIGEPLYNQLLSFDSLSMAFRKVGLKRNPQCRVCGENGITQLQSYAQKECSL
ncbi:HesA/MoeB/ThiF family protein [Helicobacter cinaedi]|uniref:HesA/MoeB/ThiF family protein n=1 Tax=Helicobacter cinaedi TaxID=213 RepID=UPI000CF0817F|nr:HesA/MoeB/ThiF family protein [Helicobacter cinaedi]AWK62062.1 HesA/MoeB/ThiF family protein [Helicobacter cinaedi]QOQ96153.1 HesA/MoeB/ThiF family protein [Helicobacter cinaedi]